MAEVGQVVEVKNDQVKVRLNRKEACAKCGACSAGLESKDMFIEAGNEVHAKKGDWVEIQLKEENFISAVLIMYIIPLGGLLAGLLIGYLLGMMIAPGAKDIIAVVFALGGAGLAFLLIHRNEERFKTEKYKPRAVRLAREDEIEEIRIDHMNSL